MSFRPSGIASPRLLLAWGRRQSQCSGRVKETVSLISSFANSLHDVCSHLAHASEERAPQEFVIDLSQEEQLGDLIVCPFVSEEAVGRKWVSGIAFIKPCVSVDEVLEDINFAQITNTKTIEFTLPKTNRVFSNKASAWKKRMGHMSKTHNIKTLAKTLSTFGQFGESNDRKLVYYKISKDDDVEISNEYFTSRGGDAGERRVDSIRVPYNYETKVGEHVYKHVEYLLIWRVYIVGSERDITDVGSVRNNEDTDQLFSLAMAMEALADNEILSMEHF